MKNLFKTMMLVAVAAMGFTACSNEAFEEVNPANEKTFTLTISAEKPALESDTRTEFFNNSVIWTANDQIRACYYHSTGVWSRYDASQTNNVAADGSTAIFTNFNDFPKIDGGSYTFYAGYPKNAIGNGNTYAPSGGELSVEVATEQTMPKAGTFDANADILLGKATEDISDIPAGADIMLSFNYTRQVAHGCVTLKNLAAEEGEVVKTVKFTAPEDVKLTGNGSVNFVEQTMTELDNNTVTVAMPTNTAANENVVVWFCSAPATIASGAKLTVEVETTRGTYTRTIKANTNGIKFLQNRYNTLSINMDEANFEAAAVSETVYKQITSMAELTSGEYVIAGKNGDAYHPMTTMFSSKISASKTILVSDNKITENDAADYILYVTYDSSNGLSIYNGSEYLKYKSSTDLASSVDPIYWDVAYVGNTFKVTDKNTTKRGILFQTSANRFGGYDTTTNYNTNGYTGLYLFKKTTGEGGGETPEQPVEKQNQTLSFSATTATATVGEVFTEPTLDGAKTTVTYTSSDTAVATVNETTGEVTLVAAGETTITASAAENETYKADSASYTLTVNPAQGGEEPDAGEKVTFELTATATSANNQLTWSQNGITIVQDKGKGSSAVNSSYNKGSNMRVYQGHTLTFSSEYNITEVKITTTGKYYGSTATANVGTLTNPKTTTCTITWEGSSKNLVITNGTGSGGEQIRATKIVITYTK